MERKPAGDWGDLPDLRDRVERYLRAHHTMTLATVGPAGGARPAAGAPAAGVAGAPAAPGTAAGAPLPHAASVFYAVDGDLCLIFLSQPTSAHGSHIGKEAPVAVTVAAHYDDWALIQGVQLWGTARLLSGAAKAAAMGVYLRRFPFVRDMMKQPHLARLIREIGVYRVEPQRVAFTDNTTGVFGREVLELVVE
jgi:hypothetical protein